MSSALREFPLISVITITLNDKAGLVKTLESVASQTYPRVDHVVIDGGSTDGSVELLIDASPRLRFTSEGDNGIFDAMNKGAWTSRGDLLVFLNSGDLFTDPEVLSFVATEWVDDPGWQWGYGALRYIDSLGGAVTGAIFAPFRRRRFELGFVTVPHPASYVSRQFFFELDGFREEFGVAADQEFLIRAARLSPPKVWVRFLSDFLIGGVHSRGSSLEREMLWHRIRVANHVPFGRFRVIDYALAVAIAAVGSLRATIGAIVRSDPTKSSP